ncbi:MAG TPA: carboxypeptidase regulatory-like domain-containing protein [Thermoanaerobaculia bacterium]|nr:carboxypeptidase regulatory-like domain-containing protein [Thermoanaerobaculia bacterium]
MTAAPRRRSPGAFSRTPLCAAIVAVLAWASLPPAAAGGESAEPAERGRPQRIWIDGRVALGQREGPAPQPGARVVLLPAETPDHRDWRLLAGAAEPSPVLSTISDAGGRFRLTAPGAGPWRLRVLLDGHLPMERRILPVPDEQELAPVVLHPAVTERIRVREPPGRPAADAWMQGLASSLDPPPARGSPVAGWRRVALAGWLDRDGLLVLSRARDERLFVEIANGWGRERLVVGPRTGDAAVAHDPWEQVAALSVRVETPGGEGIEDVLLRVDGVPWALTDTAGIGLLPAPRAALVEAVAADGRRARLETSVLDPDWFGDGDVSRGARLHAVTLTLERPRELTGQVRTSRARAPVAGAWVLADGRLARTDAEGVFTVTVPPFGDTTLAAGAVGHRWAEVRVGPASDRVAVVLRETSLAEGYVVDAAGRALAGAELEASPDGAAPRGERREAAWARSREDGSFRLRGLEPSTVHRLRARYADLPEAENRFGAPGPRATRTDLRIVLRSPLRVFGTVIEDDGSGAGGAPVAGARVWIEGLEAVPGGGRFEPARETRADERGIFAWDDLFPGAVFAVRAAAPGYAPGGLAQVELPVDGAVDVDLGLVALARGVALEVRVLDATGRPLEGARVTVDAGVPLRPREREGATPPYLYPERWAVVFTDAWGDATVADLAADSRVGVLVAHPEHVSFEAGEVAVPRREPLEVRLHASATVTGSVRAAAGASIAGAYVAIFPDAPVSPTPDDLMTHTDRDGRYRITGVPAGRHRVVARAVERAEIEPVTFEAVAGEEHRVDFRVPPSARVAGRVSDAAGAPVPGARVVAAGRLGRTDELGEFVLEHVRLGEHLVEVEQPGGRRTTRWVTVDGDAWVELELGAGGAVQGSVVDLEGRPVAGAEVVLRGIDGAGSYSARSDEDGAFVVEPVEPGGYRAAAGGPALLAAGGAVELAVREDEVVATVLRVRRAPAALSGRVLGIPAGGDLQHDRESGAPLLNAGVIVTGDGGSRWAPVRIDGSYRVEGLAPGSWRVEAVYPSTFWSGRANPERRTGSVEIVIEEGEREVTADLELEEPEARDGVRLTGRLTIDGVAPAKTYLLLTSASGLVASPAPDGVGELDAEVASPGIYELLVAAFDTTLTRLGPVDLRGDLHLELSLERLVASGAVIDSATGLPVAGAEIFVLGGAASAPGAEEGTTVVSGADGGFGVSALIDRGARLWVRHGGYRPAEMPVGPGAWSGLRIALDR